jgi:ubiquinone/menaquinone biosynthesis C-methylase UbiE
MSQASDRELVVGLWSGVADSYDASRPRTPTALLDLLPQLAHVARPRLIVDLGCGTGLSTYAWAERADEVIGIDPNDDMRAQAEGKGAGRGSLAHVTFRAGLSHATGLPDACADLVTASQSLHWMDAQPTFAEAARILHSGGVFAAYDYDWPPVITPETDQLYSDFKAVFDPLFAGFPVDLGLGLGEVKGGHLERMRQSGAFRLVREIGLHSVEHGDADRFIGLMLSNAASIALRRGLVTEQQLQLDAFRARAAALFAADAPPWYLSYRVRYAVR